MNNWYAVYTKPHKELFSYKELKKQNFKVYFPKIQKTIKHARKVSSVIRPFFPRYIFISLDISRDLWSSVNFTPGVNRLICAGDIPAKIPDMVINELFSAQDDQGLQEYIPSLNWKIGEEIKIKEGPLSGLNALFAGLSDDMRVNVLLDMMGRSLNITMKNSWVCSI